MHRKLNPKIRNDIFDSTWGKTKKAIDDVTTADDVYYVWDARKIFFMDILLLSAVEGPFFDN